MNSLPVEIDVNTFNDSFLGVTTRDYFPRWISKSSLRSNLIYRFLEDEDTPDIVFYDTPFVRALLRSGDLKAIRTGVFHHGKRLGKAMRYRPLIVAEIVSGSALEVEIEKMRLAYTLSRL